MQVLYAYSADLWLLIISIILLLLLAIYSWSRRSVPGALPFVFACVFTMLWGVGAFLGVTANAAATKLLWLKFQFFWPVPATTAILCFVLEYAQPGRWLTRRNVILLSLPSLLALALILTNGLHNFNWRGFTFDITIQPLLGDGSLFLIGYIYGIGIVNLLIFAWLFLRSPQHRWPVVLMVAGQISWRVVYLLNFPEGFTTLNPFFVILFPYSMYAVALFRFQIFDPIPLARQAVVEQMQEGMVVLDLNDRIVDLNPMAEKILGQPAKHLRGSLVGNLLPDFPDLSATLGDQGSVQSVTTLKTDSLPKYFMLNLGPLKDGRGMALGKLLLLHDVSEQRQAQAQLLDQQRVVATLEERERLARELHDNLGQVLGYLSVQAQAIHKRVRDGDYASAAPKLDRLARVAKEAHQDLRVSIDSLKTSSTDEWSFFTALQQHLDSYQDHFGIHTELMIPAGLGDDIFAPGSGVHLLRVIQEALTNARQHGRAHCIQISFELHDSQASITVADNGRGYDLEQPPKGAGSHYGLAYMNERVAQIGGQLTIDSHPGVGTRVVVKVPVGRKEAGTSSDSDAMEGIDIRHFRVLDR